MPKANPDASVALHGELAAMERTMVGTTHGEEIFGVMGAAFGAWHDVVNVQKCPVATSRQAAATVVPTQYATTHGRWNVLFGSLGRAHVGALWHRDRLVR
jgi:hypothetical protein